MNEFFNIGVLTAAHPHGELGSVPEGWVIVKIGSLGKVVTGTTPSTKVSEYYSPPEVDFIAPADLGQTRLIYNSEHKISHHGLVAIRPLPKDAVMCVCIGSSIGKVGMTCTDACATNQQINSIICSERHFPNFIYYLLNYFSEYWRGFANFGPVPILSKGRFEAIDVIVPRDRDVQQKIAAVLGLAQRAIEQQERLIALTTELKKALLHKLFTEGLRGEPQKQTEIGAVPESWKQRSLEDAGEVVYGIQAAVASNLKPVGTMILTNKNITLDGKIVLEKLNYFVLKTKRHYEIVLKTGDLLFNWRSGSKEHVGKTAYFDLAGEFVHSSFILRIRPSDKVTGRYLFYYLNFLRESGFFLKKQTFSVNAKFNKSAINELPTYLPGEEERRDIVAALDAVGKKLDTLQVKRGLLENLFRTLLHRLMTAQIRVHDLDLPELEIAQ